MATLISAGCDSSALEAENARLKAELAEAKGELEEIHDRAPAQHAADPPSTLHPAPAPSADAAENPDDATPPSLTADPETGSDDDAPPSEEGSTQDADSAEDEATEPTPDELIATLKKLRPTKKAEVGQGEQQIALKVTKTRKGKKWIFDRTGYQYFFRDADKNHKIFSLDITVSAGSHDPELPSVEAWTVEDGSARRVATFEWRFHRWDDYGSYLGNYHDSGNDFAKSDDVKFTVGQQFSDEDLAGFLIVGVRSDGTHSFRRTYNRRGRPEISYESSDYVPGSAPLAFLVDGLTPLAVLNKRKLVAEPAEG